MHIYTLLGKWEKLSKITLIDVSFLRQSLSEAAIQTEEDSFFRLKWYSVRWSSLILRLYSLSLTLTKFTSTRIRDLQSKLINEPWLQILHLHWTQTRKLKLNNQRPNFYVYIFLKIQNLRKVLDHCILRKKIAIYASACSKMYIMPIRGCILLTYPLSP